MTQRLRVNDTTIKFEIWDTAGQERFHALAPMYYRNAIAAIVVYDVTSKSSFERAKFWVDELRLRGNANAVIALVGNKTDLVESPINKEVPTDEAKRYAEGFDLLFLETSAKDGSNVKEVFEEIGKKIPFNDIAQPGRNIVLEDATRNDSCSC